MKFLCFLLLLVVYSSVASSSRSRKYHMFHHEYPVTVVLNPFQPLFLYDPPCSFNLFKLGSMARKTCENGQSLDHFGLCTPCEWDCRLGNNPTSDIYYEDYMPSRAFECACYCNDVMTTQEKISRGHGSQQDRESSRACASTYVVDDEMEQTITVLQSINIKTEHYITVEVGSRQGVWALKAAQLAKRSKSYMSVYGHSIELMDMWKGRQREKLKLNKLEDEVVLASDIITENNYPALIKNLTMRTGK